MPLTVPRTQGRKENVEGLSWEDLQLRFSFSNFLDKCHSEKLHSLILVKVEIERSITRKRGEDSSPKHSTQALLHPPLSLCLPAFRKSKASKQ